MANEPERQIEKLLRGCAKKRADDAGGPFELHPATRRLLQGEVTRRFARAGPEGASFWQRLVQFSPRLAEALVILALIAVVVSLFLPSLRKPGKDMTLSRNEPAAIQRVSDRELPAPIGAPPAAAPERRLQSVTRAPVAPAESPSGPKQEWATALGGKPADAAKKDLFTLSDALAPGAGGGGASSLNGSKRLEKSEIAASPQPVLPAAPISEGTRPAKAPSVAAAPVVPPPASSPALSGMTLAAREKESADPLRKSLDESAARTAFAFKSLDTDRFAAGSVVATNQIGALQAAAASADYRLKPPAPESASNRTGDVKLALADALARKNDSLGVQFFARVDPEAKAKSRAVDKVQPPVLVAFQLQQAGRELRITDSDGSVYIGSLQAPAPVMASAPSGGTRRPMTRALNAPDSARQTPSTYGSEPEPSQTYSFRVAGTNLSLKQQVVFTGNLTGLTNANRFWRLRAGTAGGTNALQGPAPAGLETMRYSRISGQAKVGKNRAIEIQAEPTLPGAQQP